MATYKVKDDVLTNANCNTNVEVSTVEFDREGMTVNKFEYEKTINQIQSLVEKLRKLGGI